MYYNYLVASYTSKAESGHCNNYYRGFDDLDEALEFLKTEQYDFRTRELYDCTDEPNPEYSNFKDFINDWCYPVDIDKMSDLSIKYPKSFEKAEDEIQEQEYY